MPRLFRLHAVLTIRVTVVYIILEQLEGLGMWRSVMQVLCTQLTRDETVRHYYYYYLCVWEEELDAGIPAY